MIYDKNSSVTMRRQDFLQSRERLKLTSTPPMQEMRFNGEVIVVDADDTTDKDEEARGRLLVATRNILFMPNSLMRAEKILQSHLRELLEVIESISRGGPPADMMNEMWIIVLNIMSMMKDTSEERDARNDPEFKLIRIDLLTNYVNYKARVTETEISRRLITADELERKREDLYMKLFLLLDIEDIHVLLMRLDVQKKFDGMLYPLFKNILTNPKFHKKLDIIMYVSRIICYRQWTKLTPLREEREKIYEYADRIIPRVMPKATADTKAFYEILPPVSAKRKKPMTRFLLKSKYVNDQKLVEEFLRLWKRSLSGQDVGNMNYFSDIISTLPEVEEADLQSTFSAGKMIHQEARMTSSSLICKSQGIVLDSRKKSCLVDGRSRLIDSTSQAPVINLCDSEEEVENPLPTVEILDSDDESTEKTPEVPAMVETVQDKGEKVSKEKNENQRRRLPKRRGIIVSRGRIFRTRREKILKKKRRIKGRKKISEVESSSDGSSKQKPCISVDLVSSTIVEQSPCNRTPSPNSVTSSNNYPASSSNMDTITSSFSFIVEQRENEAKMSEKEDEEESRGNTPDENSSQRIAEKPESSEYLNLPEMEDLNEICSNVSDTPLEDDFLEQHPVALIEAISENELPESGKSSRTATPVLDEKPEDDDTRCLDEKSSGSKDERVIFSTTLKGSHWRDLFADELEERSPVEALTSHTVEESENNKNLSNSHELSDKGVLSDDKRCEENFIELRDSEEKGYEEENLIDSLEGGQECAQHNSQDKTSEDSGELVEERSIEILDKHVEGNISQEQEEESPDTSKEVETEKSPQEHSQEKSSEISPEPIIEVEEKEIDKSDTVIEPCDKNEHVGEDLEKSSCAEAAEIPDDIVQDISQDEDDIPLKNISSAKAETFRVTYKLQRRLKYKPVGTYCEDSPLLYEEFFPCGEIFENLPEETEPEPIETQQDFMKLMNLMPRDKVCDSTEEIIEEEKIVKNVEKTVPMTILTIDEDSKKEDDPKLPAIYESEALTIFPVEDEKITETPEEVEVDADPFQDSSDSTVLQNTQTFDQGFNLTTEVTITPFRSSSRESLVLKVPAPEALFPANNSTAIESLEKQIEGLEKTSKAQKKILSKKMSRKERHKRRENNLLKTPFLKSALKSSSTPPSPVKRRVSFNLEISEADPEDFFKCYRIRKRREDSSDDSSGSSKRKSRELKKLKRKRKKSPIDAEKNELDVEFQKRFSQCLSIEDLPKEKEEEEVCERETSDVVEEGTVESNSLERNERAEEVSVEKEKFPDTEQYDEYEEISGEISTPEGADFMNEEGNNSLDNVETVPKADDEESADDTPQPVEFNEISGDIFVSSSSDDEPEETPRNNLRIKDVEVKLKKIVNSKKFCKQLGLKYISPDRQTLAHIEIKKKKSKKCKHKHKKRRKSRRESREIDDEVTKEEIREATEEELCEMSPPETATPDSGVNLVTPIPEKSPGSMKLKVRSHNELLIPEMKQMQQEEHVELDCEQRLDLFWLTGETNSNIQEVIEKTHRDLGLISISGWNDYLMQNYGDDTKTEVAKSKDETTPYTEESPGVTGLLNDDMTSAMPIDVSLKDGSIEIRRMPEQVVSLSEILAPKKTTPEPQVECTNFYDSGSDKNITGESFDTSHVQSSSPYVTVLSFDDIQMGKDSCEEPCEVLSKSHMTPPSTQHDNEFVTINKKDLADISSVCIPPEYDILQKNTPAETENVPEPDKSTDGSDESLGSWNSISNPLELEDIAKKVVTPLLEIKKSQEKTLKSKSKGEKVMTKAQQKEAPQVCFPIKCNERIPVSKHTPIKNRSVSTYSTSKTTIARKSPSPLPQTVVSVRENKEKTPQGLLDMPRLMDDDVEETEKYPKKFSLKRKHESPEVPKSPMTKTSGEELFDQLKKGATMMKKIPVRRSESTSSVSDIEVTSPLEAPPMPCQPPPAKIAKIYPHVVEKDDLRGRKPGQQTYKRDPFKNPEMSSSTTSAEAKSRDSVVKELALPATVDDITLRGKIVKKLSELDSRPTPTSYKEHKELKEKKESLKKHLEILSAKLKHSSSRSVSSRPVALVSPSSSNHRARTMVAMASASFDRFQADVASSSTSSTPTKLRPQVTDRQPSTSRRQPESWKPENIPTEMIIEEYQQKAREKQEAKNKPSKRHHYVFT